MSQASNRGKREVSVISVVIPVWNEEGGVRKLQECLSRVRRILRTRGEVELVFVDDGSTDGTVTALKSSFSNDLNVQIVAHEKNQGVGAAFRTGFRAARGSIICTIDADCSYRPEGLDLLLEALEGEEADIAVASPYHPLGSVDGVPPWRLFLSKCCSRLYRKVAPVQLYTYTSIFRAYRRETVERTTFRGNGFVCAPEILINAAKQGYRIVEVPMTLHARTCGQSKMKILRTIRSHLAMLRSLVRVPVRQERRATSIPFREQVMLEQSRSINSNTTVP